MSDRLPSDHATVDSHRTHVDSVGRTGRLQVPLPETIEASVGDVVRISLEGDSYHTQIAESLDGEATIRGAFANARLARTPGEGEDNFQSWAESVELTSGDPVLVDVVTPEYKFGLRRPGERVVYEATDAPSDSLTDIARDIDG